MKAGTDRGSPSWRNPGGGGEQGPPPATPRARGGLAGLLVGAGALVLVVALILVALLRLTAWRPSLTNPFGTRTIDRSQPALLLSLQDLSIYKGAIKVSEDRRSAEITLPQPTLGKVRIDPNASYVASRERGILDRLGSVVSDDPESQRELYQLADRRIQAAAQQSDLITRAEQNTRATLEGMLRGLGYTRVTVTFTGPPPH